MNKQTSRQAGLPQDVEHPRQAGAVYLTQDNGFRAIYAQPPGMKRRAALLALFHAYPSFTLPVNNKWQANMADPDLAYLLKRGVLVRVRDGGSARHPKNRSSSKRQTYLMLAEHSAGAAP